MSGVPPGGQGGVRSLSRRAGMGREALLEGRYWSAGTPEGPGGIGRTSRRSVRGQEVHPEGR